MGIPNDLILTPQQCKAYADQLGAKTLNLVTLLEAGYNVPAFVAIPSQICAQLLDQNGKWNEALLEETVGETSCFPHETFFAVRSSGLSEDGQTTSLAGQFHTEINVAPHQLKDAIKKVLANAAEFLHGDLQNFSIILQDYIEPDFSGVLFTRDPLGGRERVLEYHAGRGEELVSGKMKPTQVRFFAHQIPDIKDLPSLEIEAEHWKKIEKLLAFPQDVEWSVKNGVWYYLQTRPITTIDLTQFEQSLFLDEVLPKEKAFSYEKNEVAEIAGRPSQFTWSLLGKIYAPNGPIDRVYKKYGVASQNNFPLIKVGNELFVDKEIELKNLLPAYSYFGDSKNMNDGIPHIATVRGLWRTIKNIWRLQKMSPRSDEVFEKLKMKLSEDSSSGEFKNALEDFLKTYELIFEVNLVAGRSLKILTQLLAAEPVSIADMLSAQLPFEKATNMVIDPPKKSADWKGNALEISSEEVFLASTGSKIPLDKIDRWWSQLPEWKKKYFQPRIVQAVNDVTMREYGRWLTVKKINELREIIFQKAIDWKFHEKKNIFFADIDELLQGQITEQQCLQRKQIFDRMAHFAFPEKLASTTQKEALEIQGVSAGKAEGVLLSVEDIAGTSCSPHGIKEPVDKQGRSQHRDLRPTGLVNYKRADLLRSGASAQADAKRRTTGRKQWNFFDQSKVAPVGPDGKQVDVGGSPVCQRTARRGGIVGGTSCSPHGIILYTKMLTPDLTKYFDSVAGIVSQEGGLLSHLAIMAREKKLPVVVGFSLDESEFRLGDLVEIDGSSGTISSPDRGMNHDNQYTRVSDTKE